MVKAKTQIQFTVPAYVMLYCIGNECSFCWVGKRLEITGACITVVVTSNTSHSFPRLVTIETCIKSLNIVILTYGRDVFFTQLIVVIHIGCNDLLARQRELIEYGIFPNIENDAKAGWEQCCRAQYQDSNK